MGVYGMTELQTITVKDFREAGYLQELNRQFLHPLGMALEVMIDKDGTEHLGRIWDYRDDPEGVVYSPGVIDSEKALRVLNERLEKANSRCELLGYDIQPETT